MIPIQSKKGDCSRDRVRWESGSQESSMGYLGHEEIHPRKLLGERNALQTPESRNFRKEDPGAD